MSHGLIFRSTTLLRTESAALLMRMNLGFKAGVFNRALRTVRGSSTHPDCVRVDEDFKPDCLPITPPAEFDAAINVGPNPSRCAVTTCKLPNKALADVSDPVRNTPNQPNNELKTGKRAPVAAKASPNVPVAPE